jgi:hypothetical protein
LVSEGPAKGIYLGNRSYNDYNDMYTVIDKYATEDDAVYIVDSYRSAPYGYLALKGNYATFSPQGGLGVDSMRAVEYYEFNPSKIPTLIIVNIEWINTGLEEWIKNSEMGNYIAENYNLYAQEGKYVIYSLIK